MTTAHPDEPATTAGPTPGTGPGPRTPAQVLHEARRRDSIAKRAQVRAAVTVMVADGQTVTFAAVARHARVSTWLVYAAGVREHIDAAITAQQTGTAAAATPPGVGEAVRTDLALARQEIRGLRTERADLRLRLQGQLGEQLTGLSTAPLVDRIVELSAQLAASQAATRALGLDLEAATLDRDAARLALRQLMSQLN